MKLKLRRNKKRKRSFQRSYAMLPSATRTNTVTRPIQSGGMVK